MKERYKIHKIVIRRSDEKEPSFKVRLITVTPVMEVKMKLKK